MAVRAEAAALSLLTTWPRAFKNITARGRFRVCAHSRTHTSRTPVSYSVPAADLRAATRAVFNSAAHVGLVSSSALTRKCMFLCLPSRDNVQLFSFKATAHSDSPILRRQLVLGETVSPSAESLPTGPRGGVVRALKESFQAVKLFTSMRLSVGQTKETTLFNTSTHPCLPVTSRQDHPRPPAEGRLPALTLPPSAGPARPPGARHRLPQLCRAFGDQRGQAPPLEGVLVYPTSACFLAQRLLQSSPQQSPPSSRPTLSTGHASDPHCGLTGSAHSPPVQLTSTEKTLENVTWGNTTTQVPRACVPAPRRRRWEDARPQGLWGLQGAALGSPEAAGGSGLPFPLILLINLT